MSSLLSFGLKQPNGSWKNYTISINDTTDQFGNNVSIYESQTKEEREAKAKKNYFANGKVVWTDGKIISAEKKEAAKVQNRNIEVIELESDLPF